MSDQPQQAESVRLEGSGRGVYVLGAILGVVVIGSRFIPQDAVQRVTGPDQRQITQEEKTIQRIEELNRRVDDLDTTIHRVDANVMQVLLNQTRSPSWQRSR